MFTKYVMNNEAKAFEYYGKMNQIIGMRKFLARTLAADRSEASKVLDETSGLLILDGSKDIFNLIRFANRKLCELCGYSKENLIGQRHTKIQPDVVRTNHYKFVQSFIERGRTNFLEVTLDLWVKTSRGFIVPTQIYAKMHVDVLVGACFVGVFWQERIV